MVVIMSASLGIFCLEGVGIEQGINVVLYRFMFFDF